MSNGTDEHPSPQDQGAQEQGASPTAAKADGLGGTEDANGVPSHQICARIAVYDFEDQAPRIFTVGAMSPMGLVGELTSATLSLIRELGGGLPDRAVEEVLINLLHADPHDATISVARKGNLLRVSDRGPGVQDKERALRLGFTTAGANLRTHMNGVGAGLPLARRSVQDRRGTLVVEDNLGGGTVVTLEVPAEDAPGETAEPPATLTDRQTKVLLVTLDMSPVGPTAIADELGMSPATAYRELVRLEELGLVETSPAGTRTLTERGLHRIESLL